MDIFRKIKSSKKCGSDLVCPGCDSKKIKFIETVGRDLEIWKCKKCNLTIRYITTPYDPWSSGMSRTEASTEATRGMCRKELQALGNKSRATERNLIHIPGIGTFKARSSKRKPKD